MNKKSILIALGAILLIGATSAYYFYNKIFGLQLNQNVTLFIGSDENLDNVMSKLNRQVNNISDIKWVAEKKNYKTKSGKYLLRKGWSANDIINHLRSGNQVPVRVTFNNQTYIENLAGRISQQIEADSISILKALTDSEFLSKNGFTKQTIIGAYMPYTYECYWNISPDKLRTKLFKAYRSFWNNDRIGKAQKMHLSKNEVITLASIVHKETAHKPERKKVAGVYLNRVRKGMLLQADPTVIYALKEKNGRDKTYKRVLRKDLKVDSDYNTYKNKGIPPGPIAMPDIDAIDAVLNSEKHPYLYFCANPEQLGTHKFAKTLMQHNRNARAYQRWLSKQGTFR